MPVARKETAPVTLDVPHRTVGAVELGGFTVLFESQHVDMDGAPFFKGVPFMAITGAGVPLGPVSWLKADPTQ